MRIYEFSKKYNIPSKEIIHLLQNAGFDFKSHMSVLDQKAIDLLLDHVKGMPTITAKKVTQEKIPSVEKQLPKKYVVVSEQPKSMADTYQEISREPTVHPKEIVIEAMSLADFAQKTGKPVNELIVTLLKMGIVVTKNQILLEDVVARLAEQLGISTVKPKAEKAPTFKGIDIKEGVFKERPPVVVVLGHVDHGKTTLLDYIRKTKVAAKEKGGITQHLGAYEVKTKQGNIIFLDTPGHEAFYKIRGRGVGVADIAVLIIAADDGIMPQTIEAINHAKVAGIPIIVAINKVDKVEASRVEAVKQSLVQYNLLPEEWGGDVIVVPISAKFGQGVDHLLEMIVLQSQLMELKAEISGAAKGYILESKPEKGLGSVATLICQHGRLKVGDYFICGKTGGKVSSLIDSFGKKIKEVGPGIPVQVAGFDALAEVGDLFEVVSQEEYRKVKARTVERKSVPLIEGAFNLLIKADTNSSKEALLGAIAKLGHKLEKEFNIIYVSVGDVTESDVVLAANTGASIFAFHVKVEHNALLLIQRYAVTLQTFDVIYKLLEALEEFVEKRKKVKKVLVKIGEAVVRKVFNIKGIGVIAGSYVREGRFSRDGTVVIWRGKQKIGSGPIKSLQRERRPVKEVYAGFECGFLVGDFTDWAIDDRVECFLEIPEGQSQKKS
jgi:translation initiation factor IF-2